MTDDVQSDTELDPGEMTPQERFDRLQKAWAAIAQIDAHENQDGYTINFDEVRLEASQAVGDVIEYYRRYEGAETKDDETERHPDVQGECPECGNESLFLGEGGYVTCRVIGCENPSAPSEALGVDLGRTEPAPSADSQSIPSSVDPDEPPSDTEQYPPDPDEVIRGACENAIEEADRFDDVRWIVWTYDALEKEDWQNARYRGFVLSEKGFDTLVGAIDNHYGRWLNDE